MTAVESNAVFLTVWPQIIRMTNQLKTSFVAIGLVCNTCSLDLTSKRSTLFSFSRIYASNASSLRALLGYLGLSLLATLKNESKSRLTFTAIMPPQPTTLFVSQTCRFRYKQTRHFTHWVNHSCWSSGIIGLRRCSRTLICFRRATNESCHGIGARITLTDSIALNV